MCIFTPGVAAVAASCDGGTACESMDQVACEDFADCSYTAAVPAVDPTCVKKTLDDVIESTYDIYNKIAEIQTLLNGINDKLSTDDSEAPEGVTTVSKNSRIIESSNDVK